MRRVGIDRLREREVCAAVIKRLIQCRLSTRVCAREAADVFVEVPLALGCSDGRARTVVVVEGEVVVVLVVEEVFLLGVSDGRWRGYGIEFTSLKRSQKAE